MNRWLALTLFIVIAFVASAIGALTTTASVNTWYPTIIKPTWNPPNWVFAPVWSMLYLFMAIAVWRIWLRRAESGAGPTIVLWFVQLLLNVVWSLLFFGAHSPGAALVEIVVFWGLLFTLQLRLISLDRVAALLWAPYLGWVTFATWLNFSIWRLN